MKVVTARTLSISALNILVIGTKIKKRFVWSFPLRLYIPSVSNVVTPSIFIVPIGANKNMKNARIHKSTRLSTISLTLWWFKNKTVPAAANATLGNRTFFQDLGSPPGDYEL
jgi:hypothetical protein